MIKYDMNDLRDFFWMNQMLGKLTFIKLDEK